eukprot:GHVN01028966.1.p1 GENE.GHVN01028966.1~~GHVN01028966.1.p1  ORF type:complete len:187 (-),score=31.42 GHVN01028966.1:402-962(-)
MISALCLMISCFKVGVIVLRVLFGLYSNTHKCLCVSRTRINKPAPICLTHLTICVTHPTHPTIDHSYLALNSLSVSLTSLTHSPHLALLTYVVHKLALTQSNLFVCVPCMCMCGCLSAPSPLPDELRHLAKVQLRAADFSNCFASSSTLTHLLSNGHISRLTNNTNFSNNTFPDSLSTKLPTPPDN